MPNIPAMCDNCGSLFPSGMSVGGNAQIFSFGSKSGPCPNCGGMGSIPNGLYTAVETAGQILLNAQLTPEELFKLKTILDVSRENNIKPEDTIKSLQEVNPKLTGLPVNFLNQKEAQLFFIVVGWLIAGYLLASNLPETKDININHNSLNINIGQIYQNIIEEDKKSSPHVLRGKAQNE